jgi:hypothetical protein
MQKKLGEWMADRLSEWDWESGVEIRVCTFIMIADDSWIFALATSLCMGKTRGGSSTRLSLAE